MAANWGDKGATLTHQTAQKEFGLSETEIFDAIRAGTLQYRETSIHGNPALRLLRREVETFVRKARGAAGFRKQKVAHELAQVQKGAPLIEAKDEGARKSESPASEPCCCQDLIEQRPRSGCFISGHERLPQNSMPNSRICVHRA